MFVVHVIIDKKLNNSYCNCETEKTLDVKYYFLSNLNF